MRRVARGERRPWRGPVDGWARARGVAFPRHSPLGTRLSAYTLLELLLVLAVILAVAGAVTPTVVERMEDYKLKRGSEMVRFAISSTRIHAIDLSSVYQFRFESGGRRYLADSDRYRGSRHEPNGLFRRGQRAFRRRRLSTASCPRTFLSSRSSWRRGTLRPRQRQRPPRACRLVGPIRLGRLPSGTCQTPLIITSAAWSAPVDLSAGRFGDGGGGERGRQAGRRISTQGAGADGRGDGHAADNGDSLMRRGITLYEVVIALVIFSGSIAAISEGVSTGVRAALQSRLQSQAILLCESKMGEVMAGVVPALRHRNRHLPNRNCRAGHGP